MVYTNLEENERRMKGKNWIAAMSHYGSWELTINYVCLSDHRLLAVYRPLHNKVFDFYYYMVRSRFGTQPIPMHEIYREVIRAQRPDHQRVGVALIADQTPPIHEIKHWYHFLSQDTPFFSGIEKIARRFHMPIVFMHVRQTRPRYYEAELIPIYDGEEEVLRYEITQRYVEHLEAMIRENPHLWMWSHRRWKHSRQSVAAFWKAEQERVRKSEGASANPRKPSQEIEMLMKVKIVILNWNGREHLARFLPSVLAHSPQGSVVVADNGSQDDSVAWLRSHHPDVELIQFSENYGYAGGYNMALERVDADLFVLLNSDVEVPPHWLDPLVRRMEEDPQIAALSPKIRSFDRPAHFEYAGAAGGFIDWFGYPFCRGRILSTIEVDQGQYDDTREVFWASGGVYGGTSGSLSGVGWLRCRFLCAYGGDRLLLAGSSGRVQNRGRSRERSLSPGGRYFAEQ